MTFEIEWNCRVFVSIQGPYAEQFLLFSFANQHLNYAFNNERSYVIITPVFFDGQKG